AVASVFHLVVQNGERPETTLAKLLLDLAVAIGFSIFFINVMHPTNEVGALAAPTKYIYIFAVASVLFALELIAETAHRLLTFRRTQEQTIRRFGKHNRELAKSLVALK